MKLNKILFVSLALLLVVALGACKKSRYCHCISDSYQVTSLDGEVHTVADTTVVNVDRSMRCEHIKELGFERSAEGVPTIDVRKVDCIELDVDTVSTIPSERPVDD